MSRKKVVCITIIRSPGKPSDQRRRNDLTPRLWFVISHIIYLCKTINNISRMLLLSVVPYNYFVLMWYKLILGFINNVNYNSNPSLSRYMFYFSRGHGLRLLYKRRARRLQCRAMALGRQMKAGNIRSLKRSIANTRPFR